MSRRTARKHTFIIIFQTEFHEESEHSELLNDYISSLGEILDDDKKFIKSACHSTMLHKQEIDSLIEKYSVSWSLERLSKIDLALLRLCINEILYVEDVPERVSINEVIELSKIFSTDEAPAFINGILGKFSKEKSRIGE